MGWVSYRKRFSLLPKAKVRPDHAIFLLDDRGWKEGQVGTLDKQRTTKREGLLAGFFTWSYHHKSAYEVLTGFCL